MALFARFLRHFPSLRFVNTAAMAESVSASTKRKFLAFYPTKWIETFGTFSLTQAHSRRHDLVYSTTQKSCLPTDQLVDVRWNYAP